MDHNSLATLEAIRQSGVTNMFDIRTIQMIFMRYFPIDSYFNEKEYQEILMAGIPDDIMNKKEFQDEVKEKIYFVKNEIPYLLDWKEERDQYITEFDLKPSQVTKLDTYFYNK